MKRITRLAGRSHRLKLQLQDITEHFMLPVSFLIFLARWTHLVSWFPDKFDLQTFKCNFNRYRYSSELPFFYYPLSVIMFFPFYSPSLNNFIGFINSRLFVWNDLKKVNLNLILGGTTVRNGPHLLQSEASSLKWLL